MEALKEQEEINYRLRQYMDKIILAILDHNPSILEIKNWRPEAGRETARDLYIYPMLLDPNITLLL